MDALKYLKEIHRMCKLMKECTDCPFHGCGLTFPCEGNEESAEYKDAEKCISIVEKWSSEHPAKTRQSEILKIIPDATIKNGILITKPCEVNEKIKDRCKKYDYCRDCRKEYWIEEVE